MTIKPVSDGYTTVTPWLISRDTARLIDFVAEAFGRPRSAASPALMAASSTPKSASATRS